jgi:hypothetical protein
MTGSPGRFTLDDPDVVTPHAALRNLGLNR